MTDPIQVVFSVDQNEEGYPPVKEESIWCLPKAPGIFKVDNIPFYAANISLEDEVAAETKGGALRFVKLIHRSKNTTIRVFARKGSFEPIVVPSIESFGGVTERMEGSPLVAVSFPPSADLAGALEFLDRESAAGNLAFEESSVRYR